MKILVRWIAVLAMLTTGALRAQSFAGTWQGTLKEPAKDLRMILVVSGENGHLAGKLYSIDETPRPYSLSSVAENGPAVNFAIDLNGTSYSGKMNAAHTEISGTWTEGLASSPLEFARATKETAWAIPAPPPAPKAMPADADPAFEVATIKPSQSDQPGMQALTFRGRNFITENSSLADLMMFAYSVQMKQITDAPGWIQKDRYDIVATPDQEGKPNADQVRVMIRKLLADRFQLKFHHEQRELSAYVLTVGKDGAKLRPGQQNGTLHGIGMQEAPGGQLLFVNNAPIQAFTNFLQSLVLDRPVVDRTGLTGRYDFTVTFTPDDSRTDHSPAAANGAAKVEPAPDLFEAMQQQLGLKLTGEKTQVDVLAVDRVEKPSAN